MTYHCAHILDVSFHAKHGRALLIRPQLASFSRAAASPLRLLVVSLPMSHLIAQGLQFQPTSFPYRNPIPRLLPTPFCTFKLHSGSAV